ncbi:YncE family protein [Archangium sp.]|uniref:YncE family protein n=1 Tax=Archangium sp. TaxID=1872627 RepID=UPI002D7131C6|nr:YncE family protein [Archangium sp.]HYO59956.1 YncE family protein [Archangium sp.]
MKKLIALCTLGPLFVYVYVQSLLLERPAVNPPAPVASPAPAPEGSRIEREGLAIQFDLRPAVGAGPVEAQSEALATFTLTDARSGQPVRGARPLGWMSLREGQEAPTDAQCAEKVKTFLGGLLSVQADADMNSYFVLALNHDNTLSVINPQLAFNRTKLRALVTLSAPAADWALHPDRSALYVSLPTAQRVSRVDLRTFLATASVEVGRGPARLALAPDGRTLWVGNDGDGTVTVIDHRTQKVLATVEVGQGHHELAFADDGRTAWVTSEGADEVTVIDTATFEPVERVEVGRGAVAIAASDTARAVYVANGRTGEVVVAHGRTLSVTGRVALAPGLKALRFDPSGRWVFAVNGARGEVTVLDASSDSVRHVLTGFDSPDAVSFTDGYAYVRNTGGARISLVKLASLEQPGAPSVVDVQVGQKAPEEARVLGSAAPLVPVPEGDGVIVSSPADKALYVYREGMMAPMGTLLNYGREPRAVLVLDRSLGEVRPGVYSTQVRLKEPGTYDVAFLLDSPRVVACVEQRVGASDQVKARRAHRVELEPRFDATVRRKAGEDHVLRFRVVDSGSDRPVSAEEISVLLFRAPGSWQWRGSPRAVGEGEFEVTFHPPGPGQFKFLVGVESRGAPLGSLWPLTLGVVQGAGPQVADRLSGGTHP